MKQLNCYVTELTRIFKNAPSKDEAHYRSRQVLGDMAIDPSLLTAVLQKHLSTTSALNEKNFPVVRLDIELNPYYHLVAHCWIPLPGRETHISAKAIHHHGILLLTTATAFGPGYEHWVFTEAKEIDPARDLYSLELVARGLHSLHDVAFVDAYVPHLPMFPPGLTITLALWSSKAPTSWKDRLKRVPILKRNEAPLKWLATKMGLAKALDLKIVEYFDFYPVEGGFKGMKRRIEYPFGPNEDHLCSLFYVIQQTGNDALTPVIGQHLESGTMRLTSPHVIKQLLADLRSGRPVEAKLSECHLGLPHAMYTVNDIERSLLACKGSRSPAAA